MSLQPCCDDLVTTWHAALHPSIRSRSFSYHADCCRSVCRAKIRVLVRNAQEAVTAYSTYVTPIAGDVGNQVRMLLLTGTPPLHTHIWQAECLDRS